MVIIQGQKRVVKKRPHFFKILLGDFFHRLRIPPAFAKHISKELSNEAILRGPGGGQWRVIISKGSCNYTYFDTGWKAFAKDHRLNEHDFLVFRHNGNMHFSVRIFDKTACEREDAFTTKLSQESDYEERGKRYRSKKIKKDFGGCHSQKSKKRNREHFESGQYKPLALKVDTKNKQEFHQLTPRVKRKVCQSPSSFSSKFPFFQKCLPKSFVMRPYIMRIPADFRSHLPKRKNKFILQDPSDRNWEVLKVTNGKSITFSAGIPAFCRGNNLKEGDNCIFELLDVSKFRVHIYPVTKDIGEKKPRGKSHWIDDLIEKDSGSSHSQKFRKSSRVQNESGKNEPSARKVEMKNKQELYRLTPSVKAKVCSNLDSFSSKFPFFSKCLSKSSVTNQYKMQIPKNFHGYLPKNKSKFILQDPNGKNWELFIIRNHHIFFSRGWSKFCKGNNLKEGDICIFELLDLTSFRVHVFHRG